MSLKLSQRHPKIHPAPAVAQFQLLYEGILIRTFQILELFIHFTSSVQKPFKRCSRASDGAGGLQTTAPTGDQTSLHCLPLLRNGFCFTFITLLSLRSGLGEMEEADDAVDHLKSLL